MNLIRPEKFGGALSVQTMLVYRGEDRGRFWVGVPVAEAICPKCNKVQVNDPSNQFVLLGEPDLSAGILPGGVKCARCSTIFNSVTCYIDNDQSVVPFKFLALSVLSDENPTKVLSRGFLPGKILHKGVLVAEGARIGCNVRFTPPVLINKTSVVADECEIGPFVYLEKSEIQKKGVKLVHCDIRRSVLNRSAANSVVHDSYVG